MGHKTITTRDFAHGTGVAINLHATTVNAATDIQRLDWLAWTYERAGIVGCGSRWLNYL